MKKLNLKSVEFKNFLSYGNRPNKVDFLPGVNLVLGYDHETGKSNASGKSSFLETVPFALFGKLERGNKKDQIINWKNRKECEVNLDFSKDDNNYRITRGIKPNVFDIYENGSLINKPSHVKDYQSILEEIIGLNYKTFISIFHSNINSSFNILSMKKPEKRTFIEKVFGLELYTNIIKVCNSKISKVNTKLLEIDNGINFNEKTIDESERRIIDYKKQLPQYGNLEIELNDLKEKLLELEDCYKVESKNFSRTKEKFETLSFKVSYYENLLNKINNKTNIFLTKLKGIKSSKKLIKDNSGKKEKLDKLEKRKNKFISLKEAEEKINETLELLNEKTNEEEKILELIREKREEIKAIRWQKNEILKNIEKLEHEKVCPLCMRGLEGNEVLENLKEKVKETEKNEQLPLKEKEELEDKEQSTSLLIQNLRKKKENLDKLYHTVKDIQNEIVILSTNDDESYKIEKLEKNEKRYNKVILNLTKLNKKISKKLFSDQRELEKCKDKKELVEKLDFGIEDTEREIDKLKSQISSKKEEEEKFKKLIKTEENIIKELSRNITTKKSKRKKYKDIIDYFEYIKYNCKDEKVKQFAISYIMPYLNKKMNEYLARMEYPFFVHLDKWLDLTIKGAGISNANYNNLSGGERKSIDLSLQFSFLDISMAKSDVLIDMVGFDELLDSSMDSVSVSKVMDIVKIKQKENELLKMFIISHREEIGSGLEEDNVYFVEKKNGFSKIYLKG